MPHALHELAAAVLAEATVSNSWLSEGQLRVRLHADERGRLHRREQLRDRVHGQRLLRRNQPLPPVGMLGRWLLCREPEHLPDRLPRLPGHLSTTPTAVAAAPTAVAAATAARAVLQRRRLRVLGRQPVRQGPVARARQFAFGFRRGHWHEQIWLHQWHHARRVPRQAARRLGEPYDIICAGRGALVNGRLAQLVR